MSQPLWSAVKPSGTVAPTRTRARPAVAGGDRAFRKPPIGGSKRFRAPSRLCNPKGAEYEARWPTSKRWLRTVRNSLHRGKLEPAGAMPARTLPVALALPPIAPEPENRQPSPPTAGPAQRVPIALGAAELQCTLESRLSSRDAARPASPLVRHRASIPALAAVPSQDSRPGRNFVKHRPTSGTSAVVPPNSLESQARADGSYFDRISTEPHRITTSKYVITHFIVFSCAGARLNFAPQSTSSVMMMMMNEWAPRSLESNSALVSINNPEAGTRINHPAGECTPLPSRDPIHLQSTALTVWLSAHTCTARGCAKCAAVSINSTALKTFFTVSHRPPADRVVITLPLLPGFPLKLSMQLAAALDAFCP